MSTTRRSQPTLWAKIALVIGLIMAFGFGTASVAFAGDGDVCPPGDSGKIDVSGNQTSVTVTAPDGYLIAGYCVKAGSENSGDGPVFVAVDPPSASVTITYPSGKDISHYSLTFVPVVVESPTPTVTPTPTDTSTSTPTGTSTPTPTGTSTPTPTDTGTPTPTPTDTFPTPVQFSFDDAVAPPTCEEAGALLVDAFPGVSITVEPAFDGPGVYTLTATLDDPENTEWADGTNEPKSREVTVLGATGFQSEDPDAPCYLATTDTPTPTATSTQSVPPTTPGSGSTTTPVTVVPVSNPSGSLAQTGAETLLPMALGGVLLAGLGGTMLMAARKREH
jgi:LPXTG-motif cell wall-anchored protein